MPGERQHKIVEGKRGHDFPCSDQTTKGQAESHNRRRRPTAVSKGRQIKNPLCELAEVQTREDRGIRSFNNKKRSRRGSVPKKSRRKVRGVLGSSV